MRTFANQEERDRFIQGQIEKGKGQANQVRPYREVHLIARTDEYIVPSLSRPGHSHVVSWYQKACSCELYRQMNRDNWGISWCHHIYAVQFYLEQKKKEAK